jgi:serine/threonine-protein kinase
MGEVYRARDTKLKRDVALKVLPEAFARDPGRMLRFQREAEVLASLNHPNIAHIYGVEKRALVMEMVEGESPKGPMPFEDAWKIALQIADALEYAHERAVIHRDLKPANVKVTPDGVVKLLDFGLAKAFSETPDAASLDPENSPTVTLGATVAGTVMGTAAYMSPEQARGKKVDKRADIWSWGVVLYELLTGERLFKGGDTADTLAQVLAKQPDLGKVPPQVRKLLQRCLEKDPKQRLRDIGEARFLLEESAPQKETRFKRGLLGVIASVLAMALVIALWTLWRADRGTPPTIRLSMDIAPAESLGPTFFSRPYETAMAFAPDGNTVVFSGVVEHFQDGGEHFQEGGVTSPAHVDKKTQLYKRSLNELSATAIPGTDGASLPFFSPDGQWVGFFGGGKLKKVPLNGGPPVPIYDLPEGTGSVWGASWAATGQIVFIGELGILQVPAAGGARRVLLKYDPSKQPIEIYSSPQLLPDGKTLLFTLRTSLDWDEAEIVARRLDTGEQRSLIKGGADARYVPTGHLVYMQNAVLMAVPFNAQRLQLTGQPVAMLDGVMQSQHMANFDFESGLGQFATSASGNLVYVPGGIAPPFTQTLFRVDRKGTETKLNAPSGAYVGGRLSPDGQRLAITKNAERNSIYDIWVIDINTGNSTRLTSQGSKSWPIWSPNGKTILFSDAAKFELQSVAADGSGGVETLMAGPGVMPASVTGNRLVYFEFHENQLQVWTRLLSGPSEPKPFAKSKFSLRDAELSQDGRWMLYVSGESGANEVYVQAFPSGEKHRISSNGGVNPAWSRTGREIFYLTHASAGGNTTMMAVDFAAGEAFKIGVPHALFEGKWSTSIPSRSYDVTPDGQHFIMLRQEDPPYQRVTRLNVVVNWFDELRKRAPQGGH